MATFSNSGLVCYTKLSPNHSGQRTHAIDTITIHCIAGNMSVESAGSWFGKSSTQASCNYVVGTDGRIGLIVEEKNRSWCTSSRENDQRAVTIEVANNGGGPEWPVSDKALAALINLCADICKRNGMKKLLWRNDKSLIGQVDKQNMTVHQWFRNKACPGPYLLSRHGYIADEVNKKLGAGSILSGVTNALSNIKVSTDFKASKALGGTPEKVIWKSLKAAGLNDFAVAGVMGNLFAESGLQANNLQNTFEKKLGYTDASYTAAVDNGSYTNFVHDKAGYGLAQWTYHSRKQKLLDYARKKGVSIGDSAMQVEYLIMELKSYTKVWQVLMNAQSVQEASDVVLMDFEAPANAAAKKKQRAEYGMGYYKKNADGDSSNLPYTIKVNTGNLNIRSGPSTMNKVVGAIKDRGIYTITEEAKGAGAKTWGKLKSGAGWVSLDYCIKTS